MWLKIVIGYCWNRLEKIFLVHLTKDDVLNDFQSIFEDLSEGAEVKEVSFLKNPVKYYERNY